GPIAFNGSVTVGVTNGSSLTLSNNISGAGNLIKNNTGTLTLAGTDGHTGNVTVNDGTLILNTTNSNTSSLLTETLSQSSSTVPVTVGGNGTFRGAADFEDTLWPGGGGKPSTLNIGSGINYFDPNTLMGLNGALSLGGFS